LSDEQLRRASTYIIRLFEPTADDPMWTGTVVNSVGVLVAQISTEQIGRTMDLLAEVLEMEVPTDD